MKKLKYLTIALIITGCTYVNEAPETIYDTIYIDQVDTFVKIVYVPEIDTIYKIDTITIRENLYVGMYDFKAVGLKPMPSIFDIPMNKDLSRVRTKFQSYHRNDGK